MQSTVKELQAHPAHPVRIDESELINYQFSKNEVLNSPEAIRRRWIDLNRCEALGNLHKTPCTLVFESDTGKLIQLEALIWAVTMKSVLLKSGRLIPVSCIYEVLM
ncbi:hypothetical protein [Marinoscillum sp.]|uniref:hypothetical protein n=1 Tax=Marinoscillum sp. TaxID=2024838 RepID=UPI003BA86796